MYGYTRYMNRLEVEGYATKVSVLSCINNKVIKIGELPLQNRAKRTISNFIKKMGLPKGDSYYHSMDNYYNSTVIYNDSSPTCIQITLITPQRQYDERKVFAVIVTNSRFATLQNKEETINALKRDIARFEENVLWTRVSVFGKKLEQFI